jgi:hypothetical protein
MMALAVRLTAHLAHFVGVLLTLTDKMKIQDQVYNLIQARLKRICFAQWTKAKKNRKGRLMGPLTYPADVDRLIELSSEVLDADRDQAEAIASEVTTGSIQNAYVNR